MTRRLIIMLVVSLLVFSGMLVSGCANSAQTYGLVGGVGGALIGAVTGGASGAVVGACIGGGGGYIIGNEEDKQGVSLNKEQTLALSSQHHPTHAE